MSSQGVKTVVLYLEDWQQRMIKDTLGLSCDTYTVDVNVPSGPIVRYKVVTPGEDAALKRMYFSDWQIRELRDLTGVHCEFIELDPEAKRMLYAAPYDGVHPLYMAPLYMAPTE
jgi:hypothetical protein